MKQANDNMDWVVRESFTEEVDFEKNDKYQKGEVQVTFSRMSIKGQGVASVIVLKWK